MNIEDEVLHILKENSNVLNEASTSSDIATTQDFVGKMIDEKYNNSLAYQICEVQALKGSWGTVYASKRDFTTNDFEIAKKDIYTKSYTVKTGYTQEVWQDMNKMFGKTALIQSSNILSGLSAMNENYTLIEVLDVNSYTKPLLQVNVNNTAWITSQISQRVAESVIEMNKESFKTLDSFCVLPAQWASYFLGTASYVKTDGDSDGKDSTLFVGRYGRTDFFVNPFRNESRQFFQDFNEDYTIGDTGEEYCYVGLKSQVSGESSLVFAPYIYEAKTVVDPDTLNNNLFVYNRYGLVTSPLHEPIQGKSMLHKFIIEEAP